MKASGLVLWGSLSALALTLSADACGGRAFLDVPHVGGDAGDDGASSGSSSGVSGSSSGFSGSSSGLSGSSSGIDGGSSGSGSGSGSSSGVSGSSSGFSGSSSGLSGSSSGVSGGSSGSSSGPPMPNGSIYLEECSAASSVCQGQSFSVFAQFFTFPQGNGGCTPTATSGACAYYSCANPPPQNGDSAGTLTVSGPWLTTPVSLMPQGGNVYQYTSQNPAFTTGQTLTVSASGAMVPPFGPQSIVAPELTLLTNPPIDADGGTSVVPTGADLPIAWSGGQPGATMLFEAIGASGQDYTECSWSGSDGQGTIPAVTLKPLAGQMGYVFYGQYNETQFFAGPYAITLQALPYTGGTVQFQ